MGKNENSNPVGRGQDEDVEDQDEEQKTKVSLACTPRNGAVSNGSLVLRAEEEMCAWAFDILIAHLEVGLTSCERVFLQSSTERSHATRVCA
ncbi:putative DUF51 family protein [Toxoplasma gondii p89]|uniref:Putative DUF51 family protein n=2 Tax=Toxoplasma gondii TaxID=5811 RepID=A0A086JLA6_TOXGO|nr:putative DUF51 family protein [Toxoplasma gondii p89]KFG32924.1 putative DUF51 family protein [Toxoplasma gondii FOU]